MTIYELADSYNCQLCFFEDDNIKKDGFFIPELKIVGVRKGLPEHVQKAVILHELGHLEHNQYIYTLHPLKCENEANRGMIRRLLYDYVNEFGKECFNWLQFANAYDLNTMTDEHIIREEFKKIIKE